MWQDKAYQNTISSIWKSSHYQSSGKTNSSSRGLTPQPKASRRSSSSVSNSELPRKYSRCRVKEMTKTKKSSSPVNATNPPSRYRAKGKTRPRTPWKRTLAKKSKNQKSPVFPLHGPGHNMDLCKFMLVQVKAMNLTWSTARSGGAGHIRFQGAKKRLAKGKELNARVVNAVK